MEFAVIGDIHGRDLSGFEDFLDEEEPDKVFCTSDFDLLNSYEQFLNITEDIETAMVPANHEHAVREGLDIRSRSMNDIDVDIYDLMDQWEDSEHYSFIERVDDEQSYFEEFNINDRNAVMIHGGLEGDSNAYVGCPEDRRPLWNRLSNKKDHIKNFEEMAEKGYEIMFRSHDHSPEVAYVDPDRAIASLSPRQDGDRFRLTNDRMYTVTTGAWYDGWFLSGDTDPEGRDHTMIQYHKRDF